MQAEQPEFSISKQTLADCDVISLMSARLDGREVILVCPDGNVSRVLEIVQIGRQIAVYRRSTTSSPRGTGTGAHLIPTRRCVACRAGSSRPPWSNGDVWAAA